MTTTASRDYSNLLNADRIRGTLRRQFTNSAAEVVGELLQNSQRASATRVDVSVGTSFDGFIYEDDGKGIDGLDGFYALLCMAESDYDATVLEQQHPMGVGFHALLAHSDVRTVVVASGNYELEIDTERWWNDTEYYRTWFDRLEHRDEEVTGLWLQAYTSSSFESQVRHCLVTSSDGLYNLGESSALGAYPALGYAGILDIYVNGNPVFVDVAATCLFTSGKILATTVYEGAILHVFANDEGWGEPSYSVVNFFGQLVPVNTRNLHGFRFHLDAGSKRVVNPKSPVRAGLIQDEAYANLLEQVQSMIFAWASTPENRSQVTPDMYRHLYAISDECTLALPYFLVRGLVDPTGLDARKLSHAGKYREALHGKLELIDYADAADYYIVSDREFEVVGPEGNVLLTTRNGLEAVVYGAGLGDTVKYLDTADTFRLEDSLVSKLRWVITPGTGFAHEHVATTPGMLEVYTAFGPANEYEVAADANVLVFDTPSEGKQRFYVYAKGVAAFLAGFGKAMKDGYGEDQGFDDRLESLVTALRGLAVPKNFKLSDIERLLPAETRVEDIDLEYVDGEVASVTVRARSYSQSAKTYVFETY